MNDALFRIRDLLFLDRGGVLDEAERSELARLLAELDPASRAVLEREHAADAAALERAFVASELSERTEDEEPLPTDVKARVLASLSDRGPKRDARTPAAPTPSARLPWLGWGIAAALAVALGAILSQRPPRAPTTPPPTPDVRAIVDAAPDVLRLPLASNDPSQPDASGHVVWSKSLQRGYLDLRGVVPNDRASAQFQLWLVDPGRDPNPIDGGVFDVPAGATIVPFAPKLASVDPQVFAVTSEAPGGVVVTDGPILMLAKRE